ncbi:alpha/beta hydrolase [Paracoccus sp. S-4012]|uniref:alpha/beta hydrolase n=1 Tax=Paracoccus sp. S-4012 TaxID=2665648 RepID=UPI0018A1EDD5|nr:alpha/beta hydrolase [Paracoccus sp. S-4012]
MLALPPQSPINPDADAYAARCLELHAAAAARAEAGRMRLIADVVYGPDYWQKVDVWTPPSGRDLPVLLFFHGGNFTHGYKEWCSLMAEAVTGFPAILVSASYRLAPGTAHRDILDDCFAALKLMRDQALRFGADPRRIYLGGHSAGAQAAAEMALRHDRRETAGLSDSDIQGVFPISGNFQRRLGDLEADPALRVGADDPDSPVELVTAQGARHPFLICWGGAEKPYVHEAGAAFAAALAAGGQKVETLIEPGLDHFEVHLRAGDPAVPWTRQVRQRMLGTP